MTKNQDEKQKYKYSLPSHCFASKNKASLAANAKDWISSNFKDIIVLKTVKA